MNKTAVVIEFDSDACDLTTAEIERFLRRSISHFCGYAGLEIAHLEASSGSLQDAFGVGMEAK